MGPSQGKGAVWRDVGAAAEVVSQSGTLDGSQKRGEQAGDSLLVPLENKFGLTQR